MCLGGQAVKEDISYTLVKIKASQGLLLIEAYFYETLRNTGVYDYEKKHWNEEKILVYILLASVRNKTYLFVTKGFCRDIKYIF